MRIAKSSLLFLFCLFIPLASVFAQPDITSAEEEEDYSIYDDLDFVDVGAKRFASIKVNGKSPDKLISVGYDFQGSYDMTADAFGTFGKATQQVNATHGFRFSANIPVISKNSIIVQAGLNYWKSEYDFENSDVLTHPLHQSLSRNGLNTVDAGIIVYKPLNENTFLLANVGAGVNGDYAFGDFQPMKYNRYAAALLWGKKPTDYKQWAIGLSRTYRAGEMNYLPIIMYNWTATNRKWGVETLLPARADVRYNFSPRSMLFFGFDLEGTSFRVGNNGDFSAPFNDLEIRRSELRFRFKYERQLVGFIWMSANFGYRYNYSFNIDQVQNGEDFFRGFFGDQQYVMENSLTNPLFFNFSINLVSP